MLPTDILKEEHRIIENVLNAAQNQVDAARRGEQIDTGKIAKMVDFFRNFADGSHHAKEEKQLFAMLEDKGMPKESGPIAVMLSEHEYGRARVRAVEEAANALAKGDSAASEALIQNLTSYIDMLRSHIQKEDHILFEMANRNLNNDDNSKLLRQFQEAEKQFGEGERQRYLRMSEELS